MSIRYEIQVRLIEVEDGTETETTTFWFRTKKKMSEGLAKSVFGLVVHQLQPYRGDSQVPDRIDNKTKTTIEGSR